MDEFYTVKQAANVLRVNPLTIRRYIKEGKLKAYRAGGNIRISLNDLRAFTQNFAAQIKQPRVQSNAETKQFSPDDPLFNLKAKGLSISGTE